MKAVAVLILSAMPVMAQPMITAVLNAASKTSPIFKHGAVSPGMRVTILGRNLGPDQPVDAPSAYPLPTRNGLGGVTVRIRLVGTPNWDDCIVLLASATRVGIVLPNTAGVGNDELQLTYNGQSVTVALKGVARSPGLYTRNGYGSGQAVAVNLNSQTDQKNNSLVESAKPGQPIALLGTGLGPANGNESMRPVPGTFSPLPEVWVGGKAAQVSYAGRASCCSGYDEIDIVLPSDVPSGCYVSVHVRQGDVASNTATLAVMPQGGICSDPNGITPDLLTSVAAGNSIGTGRITLWRSQVWLPAQDGSLNSIISETLTGTFSDFDAGSLNRAAPELPSPGSCLTSFTPGEVNPSPGGSPLDAGPSLTVFNASDSRTVAKGDQNYSGPLGGGDSGLGLFLEQGPFMVTDGDGGVVGSFQAQTDVQPAFTWNEAGKFSLSVPVSGVNVTWSGGDPSGTVMIVGAVPAPDGKNGGGFLCAANNSAGRFTVPDVVLTDMPVNAQGLGPLVILVASYGVPQPFQAVGLDQASVTHISSVGSLALLKVDQATGGGAKR